MMTDELSAAVGRRSEDAAVLSSGPADRLGAALDFDDPPFRLGDPLPNAWNWLYFLSAPKASAVGVDGRGAAGELVPAFEGLNRMWAGGGFRFERPLHIGDEAKRRSAIKSIDVKEGRSGRLVLVAVEHQLSVAHGLAVTERHDLVFRERQRVGATLGAGERATRQPVWRGTLTPDEMLLFRFSALTYNGHRIHYDWRYTTLTEGYPGLLVHGPLTAILLLDCIRRNAPARQLATFEYRAMRPLFCGNRVTICGGSSPDGGSVEVWAEDHQGVVAMRGKGGFR